VLIAVVVVITLVIGVITGLRIRGPLRRGDRRRLNVLARQLAAEAQVDALTRATIRAMQASVHRLNGRD
jgi:hypothetical protein